MPEHRRDLWPPSIGHRVLVRATGRTGTIRDIVMDEGEAKYLVDLDFVAGGQEFQRVEQRLFTLGEIHPYFPP